MTKPVLPDETTDLVELDAMDVGEWESEQHTPQVGDARLDALVKQTAAAPATGMGPSKNVRHTQALPHALVRPAPSKPEATENPFDAKTVRSPISVEQAAAEIKAAQAAKQAKETAPPPPPPPTAKHTTPAGPPARPTMKGTAGTTDIAVGRPTKQGSQPLPRDGGQVPTPPAAAPTVSGNRTATPPAGTAASPPARPAPPTRPGTAPGATVTRTTPIAGVPVAPTPPRTTTRLGTDAGVQARRTTPIAGVPVPPARTTPSVVQRTTPIAGVPVPSAGSPATTAGPGLAASSAAPAKVATPVPLSPGAVRLATPSAGVKQTPPPPQDFDADSEGWSLPDADESDLYEIGSQLPARPARPPSAHDLAVGSELPTALGASASATPASAAPASAVPETAPEVEDTDDEDDDEDDEETGFHAGASEGDEATGLDEEVVDDFELPQDAVAASAPLVAAHVDGAVSPAPAVSTATMLGHASATTALPAEPTRIGPAPSPPPPVAAPVAPPGAPTTALAPAGETQPMAGAYQAPVLTPNVLAAAAKTVTGAAPPAVLPAPTHPEAIPVVRPSSSLPAAASGGTQMPFDLLPSHRQPEVEVKRDERHRRTDSFRAVGGRSKVPYVIGGALGLAAIIALALAVTRRPAASSSVAEGQREPGSAAGSAAIASAETGSRPGGDDPTEPVAPEATPSEPDHTPPAGTDPAATGTSARASGTRSSGPKATGTKAIGTKATGTKATGTKATGTKATGTKATGTKTVARTTTKATGTKKGTKGRTKPATTGTAPTRVAVAEPAPENTTAREQAKAAYNAGNQRLFAGDPQGAIRAYREALTLMPGYAPGYRGLGLAYEQAGDRASAVKALQQYVKAAPNAKDVDKIQQRITNLQR